MNCPVCKTDITATEKQYGRTPVCASCWLAGEDWISEAPVILRELNYGFDVEEAYKTDMFMRNWEITKELDALFEVGAAVMSVMNV